MRYHLNSFIDCVRRLSDRLIDASREQGPKTVIQIVTVSAIIALFALIALVMLPVAW